MDEMTTDLHELWATQWHLQTQSFNRDPTTLDPVARKHWMAQMLFGITDEVHEAAEHVAWKEHADGTHFDREAFGEELTDVLLYLVALYVSAGWTPEDVTVAYDRKAKIVAHRQALGYEGRRTR